MRYIIIPLLIILYLFWTYKSWKDVLENKLIEINFTTLFYVMLHTFVLLLLLACLLAELFKLIIKYW